MAWVSVDENGDEWIFEEEPIRAEDYWEPISEMLVSLPVGSIKKLIGRELKWEDNPVELEEDE